MATPPSKRNKRRFVEIDSTTADAIDDKNKNISELSHEELKRELLKWGEKPGPISDSTRKQYEKMLLKKMQSSNTCKNTAGTSSSGNTSTTGSNETPSTKVPKRRTTKVFQPVVQSSSTRSSSAHTLSTITRPNQFKIEGLVAEVLTPFQKNGELNVAIIPQYVDLLIGEGVRFCLVGGDAGEYKSLTLDERKVLISEWIKASRGKLNGVIFNVSSDCLLSAMEMARHAEAVGVAAIICTCPNVGSKTTIGTLTNHLSTISRCAPTLPLIYNHPEEITITSSKEPLPALSFENMLNYLSYDLSTFCAVQYNGFNLCNNGLSRTAKSYYVILGKEEQFLGGLAAASTVFISCAYNYLGKMYNCIIESFKQGNIHDARRLQALANAVTRKLDSYGKCISVHKMMLTLRGLNIGDPRPPLQELSSDAIVELRAEMAQQGLLVTNYVDE